MRRTSVNCLVYPLGVEASNVAFAAAEGTSDAPRPRSLAGEVTDTRRRTALGRSGWDARNEAAGPRAKPSTRAALARLGAPTSCLGVPRRARALRPGTDSVPSAIGEEIILSVVCHS